MIPIRAAIYARVSSEQQATDSTINSQVAALEARLARDGLSLMPDERFCDEGYSGATLVRPALERLRDTVAAGHLDRIYVHSPDRLARRYAYQVLLIDEFRRAGVEVVFLNRSIGLSPEDDLLLQVQLSLSFRIFRTAGNYPAAQKMSSEAMNRRASSMGRMVRPNGPTLAHRSFHSDP